MNAKENYLLTANQYLLHAQILIERAELYDLCLQIGFNERWAGIISKSNELIDETNHFCENEKEVINPKILIILDLKVKLLELENNFL